jgi:hypothetical protein
MEDKQDVLARAYATLSSLRKNVGEITTGVEETYVHEFHGVLDKLENIGIDVSEFRIPDSAVQPRVTAVWEGGGRSYSEEKYVAKPFILTKLDAILGYFEIIMSEKPRSIGFHLPDK